MPHYPLYAELYEANGAIYRRPPYRGLTTQANQLPIGAGDTEDLYDSDDLDSDDLEPEKYDDGPVCGVEISTEAPPGFGEAPPGFASMKTLSDALPGKVDSRVKKDGEKWSGSIDVPCSLHGLIIGRSYATAREMENATRCRITMPQRGSNSTTIRVESSAGAENVSRCLDRIEAVMISKKKWTKTHFVAIPCTFRVVQRNFHKFEDLILNKLTNEEVDVSMKNPDLFPDSAKLHMTIAMICLESDEQKETARKTVAAIQEKYKDKRPLSMEINRVDIMNDDPEQVHVLFAGANPDAANAGQVQSFFNDIRSHFFRAGLMSKSEKEDESVKLHMTIMNSRYAVPVNNNEYAKDYRNRKTFSSAKIMERHPTYPFGFIDLDTITICEFGTTNTDNGYYQCFLEEKVGNLVIDKYPYPPPDKWLPKKKSWEM